MKKDLTIFGGTKRWDEDQWTASDDSVRGGTSESYLCCDEDVARFYGTLDIKTLGGAGFASQRTASNDLQLDLSDYVGIQLCITKGDKKRYTFIIKDDLLPPDEVTGREQATISWECDFTLPPEAESGDSCNKSIFIPWDAFQPTYRGKVKKDVDPLDVKNIKRVSIMMRSFFGTQEGSFSLSIESISALCETPTLLQKPSGAKNIDNDDLEAQHLYKPSIGTVGLQVSRESFYSKLKTFSDEESTNLYVSNLPKSMNERQLALLFAPHKVCSSRILRDINGQSCGVGFARFESRDACEEVIRTFNNFSIGSGADELQIQVRYADTHEQKPLKQQTQAARQFRRRVAFAIAGALAIWVLCHHIADRRL